MSARKLDRIDKQILKELIEDGRKSTVEVADKVGLSSTPCGRRIRQLEDDGFITGYSANLSPKALGLNICVLITVKLNRHAPDGHEQFIREIESHPEVSEYILVAGNYDYLLRVWVEDTDALTRFVANVLQGIPSVSETSTMLVLKQSGGLMNLPW
tara:strand:+ start:388 stop:855 length:468 start_codon:yes stop_codon:yes gene_type:complete